MPTWAWTQTVPWLCISEWDGDWQVSGLHAPNQHPAPERSKTRDNAPVSTATDSLGGMPVKCTHSSICLRPTSTLCIYWRPNFLGKFTLQMKSVPCFTHLPHKQRAASLVQLIRAKTSTRRAATQLWTNLGKPAYLFSCLRLLFPMRGINLSPDWIQDAMENLN